MKKSPAEWRNEKKRKRAKDRVNNLEIVERSDLGSESEDSKASEVTDYRPTNSEDEDEAGEMNHIGDKANDSGSESDSVEITHTVNALNKMLGRRKSGKVNKIDDKKHKQKNKSNQIFTDGPSDVPG